MVLYVQQISNAVVRKIFPALWQYHILTRGAVGVLCQPPDVIRKGAGAMVTYGDLFNFVTMLCAVITLVILFIRKK